MKMLILAALLLVQSQPGGSPPAPRAQVSRQEIYPRFHPKTVGPFSFDVNLVARDAFEKAASQAGITILYSRDWRPATAPVQLNLQNVDIFKVLDSLTAATNTLWVPVGEQTVYIADNSVTNHRDFDLSQIAIFRVTGPTTAQERTDLFNDLRQQSGVTSAISFPKTNSFILKDSPEKVDFARQLLLKLNQQRFGPAAAVDRVAAYETDLLGNVYLLDGSSINLRRSPLNPTFSGRFSLDIAKPTREVFETVAAKAGLTVVFNRDYRPTPPNIVLKLNDVDVFAALDLLCLQVKTFWIPLGDHTIFVNDNNNTLRRDYDPQFIDVVHLTGAKTPQELNDVMNVVRQVVNATTMVSNSAANALVFRDSSERAVLAEQLIADLEGQVNGSRGTARTPSYQAGSITGGSSNIYLLDENRRNINPLITQLRPTSGPLSFDINSQPSRAAIETVAAMAGLSVVFDPDLRATPATTTLKLSNVDSYTALDILSESLRVYWLPMGNQTIFVADNNSTKRRDFVPLTLEVIDIPGVPSAQALNDIMNAVRQVLNVTSMSAMTRTNSLVIRDSPYNIVLAKRVIADLQKPAGAPVLTSVLSLETESLNSLSAGMKWISAPATAQLRPSTTGTFTLRMNEDARRAYETFGENVGLNVVFDPQFKPGQASAFQLENVDVIQALNLMAKQTGNYWQVVDNKTIYVTPERVNSARPYEPITVKSFHLKNVLAPDLDAIVNLLKSLAPTTYDSTANSIDVRSTPTNFALIEKLIAALDRPASTR